MKVTIDKNYGSVAIDNNFPVIDLNIGAMDAYKLLQALDEHRDEIRDLAYNYYECSDCDRVHPKGTACPNVRRSDDED